MELKLKIKLIVIVVFMAFCGMLGFSILKSSKFSSYFEEAPAIAWCEHFMDGDFRKCDNLVASDDEKISNSKLLDYMENTNYYDYCMKQLSGCIKSTKVNDIIESGKKCSYIITVVYEPFKPVEKLELPKAQLRHAESSYATEKISKDDFKIELNDAYRVMFETSLFNPSGEEQSIEIEFVQTEEGLTGVSESISRLMGLTNITNNLLFFETNAKSEVDNFLRVE